MISQKAIKLLNIIILLEKKANWLIELLANEQNLNIKDEHPFVKLLIRKNKLWKGSLKGDWSYRFHGDSCKFENIKYGQVVVVKINRKGNYGTITNDNLLKFIETTNELNYVYNRIYNSESIYTILNELEKQNLIINIGNHFETRIINKEKLTLYNNGYN